VQLVMNAKIVMNNWKAEMAVMVVVVLNVLRIAHYSKETTDDQVMRGSPFEQRVKRKTQINLNVSAVIAAYQII